MVTENCVAAAAASAGEKVLYGVHDFLVWLYHGHGILHSIFAFKKFGPAQRGNGRCVATKHTKKYSQETIVSNISQINSSVYNPNMMPNPTRVNTAKVIIYTAIYNVPNVYISAANSFLFLFSTNGKVYRT